MSVGCGAFPNCVEMEIKVWLDIDFNGIVCQAVSLVAVAWTNVVRGGLV